MKNERMWKIKRKVARKYDALADAYDGLYGEEQKAKIKSALEFIQLRKSDLVLDVGCGTGLLFPHIEENISLLIGLDISRRLLEKAQYKSKSSQKISLIRADADHLPFIDEVFDKIFAITVLQNMPNVGTAFNELIRTAERDALFIVTGLKKSFTEEQLLRLLRKTGLKVLNIKTNGQLLGFVVVCRKKNRYK